MENKLFRLQVVYFSKLLQALLMVIKQPSTDMEYVLAITNYDYDKSFMCHG